MTIYHCTSCDVFSKTAPLCIEGQAYGWDPNDTELSVVDSCSCVCHNGSSSADLLDAPDGKGPGFTHDIDAEYEELCVHAPELAAA